MEEVTRLLKPSNYFQSIGQAKVSMFLSLLRQVILLIPCLLILPHIGGLGLTGVWLAGPVADGLASLITGIIFFRSVRGLKEAKEAVDNAPKVVKEGASKEEAEDIKAKFEAEGAKVTIK